MQRLRLSLISAVNVFASSQRSILLVDTLASTHSVEHHLPRELLVELFGAHLRTLTSHQAQQSRMVSSLFTYKALQVASRLILQVTVGLRLLQALLRDDARSRVKSTLSAVPNSHNLLRWLLQFLPCHLTVTTNQMTRSSHYDDTDRQSFVVRSVGKPTAS